MCLVVRTSYPDPTAWDPAEAHFDPKSDPDNPRWFMVDIQFNSKFSEPQSLEMLRADPELSQMELLRKGTRLSVQPVTNQEFAIIEKLGRKTP